MNEPTTTREATAQYRALGVAEREVYAQATAAGATHDEAYATARFAPNVDRDRSRWPVRFDSVPTEIAVKALRMADEARDLHQEPAPFVILNRLINDGSDVYRVDEINQVAVSDVVIQISTAIAESATRDRDIERLFPVMSMYSVDGDRLVARKLDEILDGYDGDHTYTALSLHALIHSVEAAGHPEVSDTAVRERIWRIIDERLGASTAQSLYDAYQNAPRQEVQS